MITQERLKECLSYDPDTGIFTWIKPTANRVKLGSVAGCKTSFSIEQARIEGRHYVAIRIDGILYGAHRLAVLYMDGVIPEDSVDHINGDGWDNRWGNIRVVTSQQNQRNMKVSKSNKSGVTGVYRLEKANRWLASIGDKGKSVSLGRHKTFQAAVEARMKAELELGYHSNHGQVRP